MRVVLPRTSREATPRHRPRPRLAVLTMTGAALALTAAQLVTAGPASAAVIVSQAQGRFLGGSAGGTNLDTIVALTPAAAQQPDGPASDQHPLDASVLNAVNIDLGSGVSLLGGSGLATVGTVNQVAVANPDGSSSAGSGAVDGAGAISAGAASTSPSNATVNLTPILARGGTVITTALSAAGLSTGALAAHADQAAGSGGAQSGDYWIDGLDLSLTSPLIADVGGTLTTAFAPAGTLQTAVSGITGAIATLLGPTGLSVTNLPDLAAVLDGVLGSGDVTAAGGAIQANLLTGTVTVDIEALLAFQSLDLNNLPPNTDLLPIVTAALTSELLPAITGTLADLTTALTDAFDAITVTVLGAPVPPGLYASAVTAVLTPVLGTVSSLSGGLAATVIDPLADALDALLSLQANGQATTAGTFTETALTVGLLPGGTPLASLALASASVGPNAGPQPPALTGINPNTGPTSGGQGVTVTGSGFVAGATSITIGGTTIPAGQVNVTSPSSLTFVTPPHAAGLVDVTATTTVGTSGPLGYTYVAPAPGSIPPPVITAPADGSTTTNPTVPVAGTGIVGDTVNVSEGANAVCSAVVSPAGTWTCSPSGGFILGAHTIVATQTDGTSTSANSAAVTFTVISAGLIPAPVITSPADGAIVTDPNTPVTGTGIAGNTVTVTEGDVVVCTATVSAAGTWSCSPPGGFGLGLHTIVASQSDGVTVSPNSTAVSFTVVATTLPNTGAASALALALGVGLVLLGGVCLFAVRRNGHGGPARVDSV